MNEHEALEQSKWLFYALGYIGVFGRVLWESLRRGRTFAALFHYAKKNSLVIFASFIAYNAVVAIWMWTDMFVAAGLLRGELNAMTIVLGVQADMIFKKAVESKTGEVISGLPAKKEGGSNAV